MQRSGRVTSFVGLGEQDRSFRLNPISPAGGFGVLTIDGDRGELVIYVKDLRPLRDNLPPGHFFYEGWLICSDGKRDRFASTGAFNTDECGQGKSFFVFDPANLRGTGISLNRVKVLAVTAEPQDGDPEPSTSVVLAGEVVLPAGLEFPEVTPEHPPGEEIPIPCVAQLAEGSAQVSSPPPDEMPEETSSEPAETAGYAQPAGAAEDLTPEEGPASPPPGYIIVKQAQEVLEPLIDQIRDTNATALIDFAKNSLVVTLRGLPAPAAFGYDPSTARNFNVYECWLGRSWTGERTSIGYFRKIWHDTYRIQHRPGEPLARYDTIIVTAGDRAAGSDPDRHNLFQGRYTMYMPAIPPMP